MNNEYIKTFNFVSFGFEFCQLFFNFLKFLFLVLVNASMSKEYQYQVQNMTAWALGTPNNLRVLLLAGSIKKYSNLSYFGRSGASAHGDTCQKKCILVTVSE